VPTKVAYKDFEASNELEFEFYLAQKLSRTVEELRSMQNDEFIRWGIYYARIAQRQELENAKLKGGA
jgi:hypothetical protein